MKLIDTHCHLHDSEFFDDETREAAYEQAVAAGVGMICVGTDVCSSREAVEFAQNHENCWAIVGIHPHEAATNRVTEICEILEQNHPKIVGIGEIGLDYFYDHSPREVQATVLREQLKLAREFDLPISFHVREAFDDFWPLVDEFPGVRGVLHSFTDSQENLDIGLAHGLFVGINGISTFTRDEIQQKLYRDAPLERILLETDAPFLTPKPFRGKMNVPAYVGRVAEHQAMQKNVSPDEIMRITTENAEKVFGINHEHINR